MSLDARETGREKYWKNGPAMLWRALTGTNKGNRTTVWWAYLVGVSSSKLQKSSLININRKAISFKKIC